MNKLFVIISDDNLQGDENDDNRRRLYRTAKDLTPDKIKRLAKGYAINTMNNFKADGKNILYVIAGVFSLFNVYGSEEEEKEPKT